MPGMRDFHESSEKIFSIDIGAAVAGPQSIEKSRQAGKTEYIASKEVDRQILEDLWHFIEKRKPNKLKDLRKFKCLYPDCDKVYTRNYRLIFHQKCAHLKQSR